MKAALRGVIVGLPGAVLLVSVTAFAIIDKRHPAAVTWAWAGVVSCLVLLAVLPIAGREK